MQEDKLFFALNIPTDREISVIGYFNDISLLLKSTSTFEATQEGLTAYLSYSAPLKFYEFLLVGDRLEFSCTDKDGGFSAKLYYLKTKFNKVGTHYVFKSPDNFI